jgi:hypothetical protein
MDKGMRSDRNLFTDIDIPWESMVFYWFYHGFYGNPWVFYGFCYGFYGNPWWFLWESPGPIAPRIKSHLLILIWVSHWPVVINPLLLAFE